MSETKPADLTLSLQKSTEGFTAVVDQPTDTDIIDIRKILLPVLMKTKYTNLALTYNLSGVILPTDRYKHIYSKGAYSNLLAIALYDDTIYRDARRTEVHQAKGKHEARRNDRALYETADAACNNFIIEVIDETWYKDLEEPDTL